MKYKVEKLKVAHLPQVLTLQQQVMEALENKQILQPLDEQELRFIIEGHGVMIGLFDEEALIAFRALLEPPLDEEHLGYDIGFARPFEEIIYQEISNVHPAHRGQGLQQKMAQLIMDYVDTSKYSMMCSTVMPFNIASLKDKFGQGMYVAALKLKYGGKLRYVFAKSLVEQEQWQEGETVMDMADTAGQQQLLKEGYFGVAMQLQGDMWTVSYKKKQN